MTMLDNLKHIGIGSAILTLPLQIAGLQSVVSPRDSMEYRPSSHIIYYDKTSECSQLVYDCYGKDMSKEIDEVVEWCFSGNNPPKMRHWVKPGINPVNYGSYIVWDDTALLKKIEEACLQP